MTGPGGSDVSSDEKRPAPTFRRSLRVVFDNLITYVILTAGAIVMLFVGLLTLFRTRRIYNEILAKWVCRAVLAQRGIRMKVHRDYQFPAGQAVYITNHTSAVDVFVVVALGLPNCRYFLHGGVRVHIPLGVMATIMGTFFTMSQELPEKRAALFRNAANLLRKTGESVFLTPEGDRITTGQIGAFNKGAFHLATDLGAPIVPFYIQTPRASNAGMGSDVRAGCVQVYFMPVIPTADWRLEDLERNKEDIRALFINYHEELDES